MAKHADLISLVRPDFLLCNFTNITQSPKNGGGIFPMPLSDILHTLRAPSHINNFRFIHNISTYRVFLLF